MTSVQKSKDKTPVNWAITYAKSLGITYVFTTILVLIFSFVVTYTNLKDTTVSAVTLIISVISMILCGFLIGRKAQTRGWLFGGIGGIIYTIILYCIAGIFFGDFSFNSSIIPVIIMSFFAGAFGGIVGINKTT